VRGERKTHVSFVPGSWFLASRRRERGRTVRAAGEKKEHNEWARRLILCSEIGGVGGASGAAVVV